MTLYKARRRNISPRRLVASLNVPCTAKGQRQGIAQIPPVAKQPPLSLQRTTQMPLTFVVGRISWRLGSKMSGTGLRRAVGCQPHGRYQSALPHRRQPAPVGPKRRLPRFCSCMRRRRRQQSFRNPLLGSR